MGLVELTLIIMVDEAYQLVLVNGWSQESQLTWNDELGELHGFDIYDDVQIHELYTLCGEGHDEEVYSPLGEMTHDEQVFIHA